MGENRQRSPGWESDVWQEHPVVERRRITHGIHLRCFCPFCNAKLNDRDQVVFEVETNDDQVGLLRVAACLNIHHHETELEIEDSTEVRDLRCTHCHRSLLRADDTCPRDGARMAGFKIAAGQTRVDFQVCVHRGCRYYRLGDDDEQLIILEDSHEW